MSDLIWNAGAWRTPEAVERRKEADRKRKKKKYDEDLESSRFENRFKYWSNVEKERERSRDYYNRNKEVENEKRVEWGRKNNLASRESFRNESVASKEIKRLNSQLRERSIDLDEYTRRVSEEVAKHNERIGYDGRRSEK